MARQTSTLLNLVARWLGTITTERIRRGVFTSVPELEAAIHPYITPNNADPIVILCMRHYTRFPEEHLLQNGGRGGAT